MRMWFFLFTLPLLAQALPIRVEKGKQFDGDLFSFGDTVVIEGEVIGDVSALFADVRIRGKVSGNISVMGGKIHIEPGAVVDGKLVCMGGTVEVPADIFEDDRIISVFSDGQISANVLCGNARISMFFFKILFMFIMLVLCVYILPNQVRQAGFELYLEPWRVFLLGLITLGILGIGLFLSFLLMALAIGIPLFFVCAVLLVIATLFGQIAFFYQLSQTLERRTEGRITTVWSMLICITAFALLIELPIMGPIVQFAILVLGLGMVVASRFGTDKMWLTRKKKIWSAA